MNVTNNINAKTKNVLDNFNDCKDFVELETDAYIVAAAMKHFNMKSLEDQVVPQLVHKGTKETRRVWIHNQAKEILEKFVMTRQSAECMEIVETVTEANQRKVFFCSVCGKRYFYEKARDNHERKQHPESSMASEIELENSSASSTPPSEDYVYNYACVCLSFGMLIQNFNDAVREGDGLRILRCWKFLLLSYKANKHHKYAFPALHLIAKTISLLTLQQAKRLVWNRTVNNRGGEGRNISLDLRLEHLVHLLKELLANLGVNLTTPAAERCSEALKLWKTPLLQLTVSLKLRDHLADTLWHAPRQILKQLSRNFVSREMCFLTEQRITGSTDVSSISREAFGVTRIMGS